MLRRWNLLPLVVLLVAVFGFQTPAVPAEGEKPFDRDATYPTPSPRTLELLRGDVLALDAYGPVKNGGAEPTHPVFTGNLYSLATGELVGTIVDDVQCFTQRGFPCNVVDVTTTFNLPEGQIVNRMFVSVDPDPQKPPGYFLTGSRQDGDTVVSGTGIYGGRTGNTRLSGHVDLRNMPAGADFDDWFTILFKS